MIQRIMTFVFSYIPATGTLILGLDLHSVAKGNNMQKRESSKILPFLSIVGFNLVDPHGSGFLLSDWKTAGKIAMVKRVCVYVSVFVCVRACFLKFS